MGISSESLALQADLLSVIFDNKRQGTTRNMAPRRDPSKTGGKSKIPSLGAAGKNGAKGNEEDETDLGTAEDEGIIKIISKLSVLDNSLGGLTREVREGLQSVEFRVGELGDRVKANEKKCEEATEKVREVTDTTSGLKTRSAVQGARLNDLERQIEQLERDKRRNLIIIEGVEEDENNPSPEIVELLFQDLKVGFDTPVCDRVYRRGKVPPKEEDKLQPEGATVNKNKRGEGKPRPIVVGFKLLSDKIQVYKHLKNLQGIQRWERVYISDDLTESQQRQLRDLRSLSAFAKSLGYASAVRSNCLVVEGRKYTYKDLHRLSPEITLEKAKTVKCLQGKGVAFQSVHSPLSNLYPCNVFYKGISFLSAEGALQHTRAIFCRRLEEARAIETERDAYEVKRIAGTFKHPQEWEAVVVDILIEILVIKFTANRHCREVLLATGDCGLFEATGDRTWACGLPLSKIHELTIPPVGRNRTGVALEKVRQIVKGK